MIRESGVVTLPLLIACGAFTGEAAGVGRDTGLGDPKLPRLTNAVQLQRLSPAEAEGGYPACLRGVTTFYDGAGNQLVLQDGSGGVVVRVGNVGFEPGVGQLLEVEGTTHAGQSAPELWSRRVTLIGEAPLPPLCRVTEAQLAAGEPNCCWVEVKGVVRGVTVGRPDGFLGLELATSSNRVAALIKRYTLDECKALVDAEVAMAGVLRRSKIGKPELLLPSMGDITVSRPAPTEPFAAARQDLGKVRPAALATPPIHRIKVSGVVTAQQPGRGVFLQQGPTSLPARSEQRIALHPGDRVEVVGFPALDQYSQPWLESALVRKVGGGPAPVPVPITPETAAGGLRHAALVTLEGVVLPRQADNVLALRVQAANTVFTARLDDPAQDFPAPVREGSRVRLTGICLPRRGGANAPAAFEVLLRSPADVTLLEAPPAGAPWSWLLLAGALAALAWLGTRVLYGRKRMGPLPT